MKAKQMGALLLAVLMLSMLAGCGTKAGGPSSPSSTENETPAYPWMAGESPIPDRRIGLTRQGIGGWVGGFAVTETGYYIMGNDPCIPGDSCLFYGDHGSDTIVKLCGRPDCDHLNKDCNAWFDSSDSVYYDGSYLFVNDTPGTPRVIRMDLDGGNQEVVFDLANFSSLRLGSQYSMMRIINGIFSFSATRLNESGEREPSVVYYKLDGSMEEPGIVPESRMAMMESDGEGNFISIATKGAMILAWDPETNEVRELTEKRGSGYYGMEDAWYVNDGVIYHLNYASGKEEVLLDTGLRLEENESMSLSCFPDHLALQVDNSKSAYSSFYFYNWAMEPIGQIDRIDGSLIMICGETADRLIISSYPISIVPQYYVEKSDFGTGHVELHEFNMPDIDWAAAEEKLNSISGN